MLYQYMVDLLHQLHYVINANNYDLRKLIREEMLPLSFSMNKQNYARCGTYYMQLAYLKLTHPGDRQEIEGIRVSVCRNTMNICQSIDATGNSKNSGGIKDVVTQDCPYEKWVLSRPGTAEC